MSEYIVADADNFEEGERITVQLEGREVSVFNVDGELFAYTNWCPHQSGPVCEGMISGTWEADIDETSKKIIQKWGREGEILNCPWHGWEFDIRTGESLAQKVKLISHDVTVEDGKIVVSV